MSKYIPVEPEKWAEMVKAQSDLPRWKEMCDELEARCNALKAEVERLTSVSEAWKKRRLDKVEEECIKWSDYEKLKAENERLRKAGDAMAEAMWYGYAERSIWVKKFAETAWLAAKEGKQP